jgi:predicted nucleic acid-binding protein
VIGGVDYVEMTVKAWQRAGDIASILDGQSTPIPLADAIVAAVALEGDHEILTRDKHFERIPGLRLYDPDKEASDA